MNLLENINPKSQHLKMYVCGPTVYDHSHIGHARTYMTVDIINRIMINIAHQKTHLVMNITDIDDKIIRKAIESNSNWLDIAKKYENSFFGSLSKLNVKLPDTIIRVSEVIPEIVQYIQKIINNGFAYITSDGSVYFDTATYISEGYDFSTDLEDDEECAYQSEISVEILLQKKNRKDFALWKGRSREDVGFDVVFTYQHQEINSWGRPGWHIECSAMIDKTIGSDLDIHFGGIDLKFPHHYNERLQAHAFYHPQFKPENDTQLIQWTNNFMHVGHLCIKGKKMSKSLKNFTTINDALEELNANQLRWMFMLHKLTDCMDFSDDTIVQGKTFDSTITNFFNRIINYPFDIKYVKYNTKEQLLSDYYYVIIEKINSDLIGFKLDTAVKLMFELINKVNSYVSVEHPNESLVRKIYDWLLELVTQLGFIYQKNQLNNSVIEIMNVLIDTRTSVRMLTRDKTIQSDLKQKIFQILDRERNIELPKIGIQLQDVKDSSNWFYSMDSNN
jgi:cysteinyl-tRNA synthetase